MTPTMKGFIFGIAAVAIALFFGFGGGVMIADWLNKDTQPRQTRVEKVKATDGRGSSAPEISAAREEPKKSAVDENPLIPKKVVTEPVRMTPPAASQPDVLPLTSTPLAGPQNISGRQPAGQSVSQPAPQPRQASREPAATSAPATTSASHVQRSRAGEPQIIKQEPRRRDASRDRKNPPKHAKHHEAVGTTGSASGKVFAFDDEAPSSKSKRSERQRKSREVRRDDDDIPVIVEQRPAASIRPFFGLFGF